MATDDEKGGKRHHGKHFFIPAGVLIGLGVGLIAGYPGAGVLIGLGLGLIGSAFQNGECAAPSRCSHQWISVIVGLFLILVGIATVWSPPNFWPYIAAVFLIALGVWFLARGVIRTG